MIWDWVEGDALICEEGRDAVPVSWTQVVSAEGIGSLLEISAWYVADCEGDIPLYTHLPYISGASLEERIFVLAGLEDGDSAMVVAKQVEELVCELWGPQFDGQSGIESLEVTDGRVGLEYPGRKGSMICSVNYEGSAARHAGIDVKLYQVPLILVNDESAIRSGEVPIEPGQVLAKLRGEGEEALFRALPEGFLASYCGTGGLVDTLVRHTATCPGVCEDPGERLWICWTNDEPRAGSLSTFPGGGRQSWQVCQTGGLATP